MNDSISRRDFLKKSGQATAGVGLANLAGPAVVRARGANEQSRAGFIGIGIRGNSLLTTTLKNLPEVRVVGVCDAYQGYVKRAVDNITNAGQPQPEIFGDYRALLDSKNIDAVVIATPEHWHHRMMLDTLSAGKDLYIEKALTHTVKEGEELVKAAQHSKSVVQVGTQRRSSPIYVKAREMYQSGILGKVTTVRVFWFRNTRTPQWRYPIPADASPQTCKWEAFLGNAPKRPWDAARMFQWRLYWDYSQGIATDLMTHQLDAVHMVTGETAPGTVIAQGGIYLWNDGREVPDTWHSVLQYKDFTVDYTCMFGNSRFGYGEQFLGSEGTLELLEMKTLLFTPEKFTERGQDVTPEKIRSRAAVTMDVKELDPVDTNVLHLKNFFDCVKSRKQTNCPVTVGEQAATPCHLAVLAFQKRRQVNWDPASRKITLV